MTQVTLTRFRKTHRFYNNVDTYRACLDSSEVNCPSIQGYMNGLIRQMQQHANEPTGWSFAEWNKGSNVGSNFRAAHAITLEYAYHREDTELVDRIHDKAKELGWAFFIIDTETKHGNTLSIVWPLSQPIKDGKVYARLASIRAEQMDEYMMQPGSIAASHIVTVHRTSTPCVFQGRAMCPQTELTRTAKLFPKLNARRFEGRRPVRSNSVTPSEAANEIHDGLFVFFESAAEKAQREALEVMTSYGFAPQ